MEFIIRIYIYIFNTDGMFSESGCILLYMCNTSKPAGELSPPLESKINWSGKDGAISDISWGIVREFWKVMSVATM